MLRTWWVGALAVATCLAGSAQANCVGDCNGDGNVTVDEIVLMVNIALESRQVDDCPAGDRDGSGTVTVEEIVAAVNFALDACPVASPSPSPSPSPTSGPSGPLGDRRFTLSDRSEFRAVLSGGFSLPLGSFRGQKNGVEEPAYLVLRAGEPDSSGLAPLEITEASDYFFVDARRVAQIVLCLKPLVPIRNAGVVACQGGFDYSIILCANHRLGQIGHGDFTLSDCLSACNAGGCGTVEAPDQICAAGLIGEQCRAAADCDTASEAGDGICGLGRYCTRGRVGEPCASDAECATDSQAGTCRPQPTCRQGRVGNPCRADAECDSQPGASDGACGPGGVHPGVCNGTFSVSSVGEDSGPGAAVIAPVFGLTGFPAELAIERDLPCGDEAGSGFSQAFAFTTATVRGEIQNANNEEGSNLVFTSRGENFSCTDWTNPEGPGCFALVAPALHTFQGSDLITSFRFCGH